LASLHQGNSSVRSIRDGLSYRNGVLAADLAARGVRGDAGVFDGPYGFYKVFFRGEYDRDQLVDGLGTRFETARVALKPWPAIRHLHRSLTAVLDIMAKEKLRFDDIVEVVVHIGESTRKLCKTAALGDIPAKRMDLLSTLGFVIGAAIRHGGVPLVLYRDTALADDVIEKAMPKVRWVLDARLTSRATFENAHVEITTRGGRVHVDECSVGLGHPDNPMSLDRRLGKFRECAQAARNPPSSAQIDDIIAAIDRLEHLEDIASLSRLLA
jgi:2-methylcitrate dehydratase PrpD